MIKKSTFYSRLIICKSFESSGWLSPKEIIIQRWEKFDGDPVYRDQMGVLYDRHLRLLRFPNDKVRQNYITYYLREGVLPGNREIWYVMPNVDLSIRRSKELSVFVDDNLVEYDKDYKPTKFKNPQTPNFYHTYAKLHGAFPYTIIKKI
jgi:hypothetical protein